MAIEPTLTVPGDFVNDIVIVCTLAILIGQNLRADFKDAAEVKKRDIRKHLARLDSDKVLGVQNIGSLYEKIKNFSVTDRFFYYLTFFYCCILLSVLLDLITLNKNTLKWEWLAQFPVEATRFWFEIVVWISLFFYGFELAKMKMANSNFIKNFHNLMTLFSVAESIVKGHPDKTRDEKSIGDPEDEDVDEDEDADQRAALRATHKDHRHK